MRPLYRLTLIVLIWAAIAAAQTGPYSVRHLVDDGCWTWFNDERALVDGNSLIIGSIDSAGVSRVDVVTLRNTEGTVTVQPYPLSRWKSKDDHNNPALLKLSNGQLLAAYAKHHLEPICYWRLARMHQSTVGLQLDWGPERQMTVPAKATYNNLFQLTEENDRIYNFIRCVGFNPNVMVSDDQGQSWSDPLVLIKSGGDGTRPYVKYFSNGKDRIDFLYTDGHPRQEPTNNVYHLFYQDGAFRRSDGSVIKTWEQLSSSPLVPRDGTVVYDGSRAGRGWVWDFEYDLTGQPVAAYINSFDHEVGNDLRYRYGRWFDADQAWSERQIAYAGTHLYVPENHYAGGIAIDPENIDQIYISADVNPVNGKPLTSGHYQIFQGVTSDQGQTWGWTQLTFDSEVDNIRPIVPRNHGCTHCVIWLQGEYRTYTDYQTRIVGIIEK